MLIRVKPVVKGAICAQDALDSDIGDALAAPSDCGQRVPSVMLVVEKCVFEVKMAGSKSGGSLKADAAE
jgi:hypothetical protein